MNTQDPAINRRAFLAVTTLAVTTGACVKPAPNTAKVVPRKISPNEKLNIAAIGVGVQGSVDVMHCASENIVALCDVDWGYAPAARTAERLPGAKRFDDYRRMFDAMPGIDAVTVSTPDHHHAPAASLAMRLGKHAYVQKPMAHTVFEARRLAEIAREHKVATQMGIQAHSGEEIRRLREMIESGAIGTVREVHHWTFLPDWPQPAQTPLPAEPVPESLHWDLWLGPAATRPYNSGYAPDRWRGWWEFGSGALGDIACHTMDSSFYALGLDRARRYRIAPVFQHGKHAQVTPNASILQYTFPPGKDGEILEVYWRDGDLRPDHPQGVPESEMIGDGEGGSLFIGTGGLLTAGVYHDDPRLLPASRMTEYTVPAARLPRVESNDPYKNWIQACKGGAPAVADFAYSGPLTEMILLGAVALKTGRTLEWDADRFEILNDEEANALLTKPYREGWTVADAT